MERARDIFRDDSTFCTMDDFGVPRITNASWQNIADGLNLTIDKYRPACTRITCHAKDERVS